MSAGTDFLASLQKMTVKNTVQKKQQKRANAPAVDVSALLEAALRQKKPAEAVADVRQSADVATASFLLCSMTVSVCPVLTSVNSIFIVPFSISCPLSINVGDFEA